MTNDVDEPLEPVEQAPTDAGKTDRLFWRASLGQATFDLLAVGQAVTIDTLIAHL